MEEGCSGSWDGVDGIEVNGVEGAGEWEGVFGEGGWEGGFGEGMA